MGWDWGPRFTFTIPAVEEAVSGATSAFASASTRASRRIPRDNEERVRVLAVDDDPQFLRYVRDTLVQAGFDPVVTGAPEDALRLMEEQKPQLALLDLMLPGSNGIELMRDILKVAKIPVIFLSAYGRDDLIAQAFDTGGSGLCG